MFDGMIPLESYSGDTLEHWNISKRVERRANLTLGPLGTAGDVVAPATTESPFEGGDAEVAHAAAVALGAGHRREGGAVQLRVHLGPRMASK